MPLLAASSGGSGMLESKGELSGKTRSRGKRSPGLSGRLEKELPHP